MMEPAPIHPSSFIPHPSLSWVFFDLDGTLWDHARSSERAVLELCGAYGLTPSSFLPVFRRCNEALWKDVATSKMSFAVLRIRRFEMALQQTACGSASLDAQELSEFYLKKYVEEAHLVEDAAAALSAASGVARVAVLTNGACELQEKKLAHLGEAAKCVEFMVCAEEVNAFKPDPAFYAAALRRAGDPDPAAVMMVGDSFVEDAAAPRRLGWQAAWISEGRPTPPDAEGIAVYRTLGEFAKGLRTGIEGLRG